MFAQLLSRFAHHLSHFLHLIAHHLGLIDLFVTGGKVENRGIDGAFLHQGRLFLRPGRPSAEQTFRL